MSATNSEFPEERQIHDEIRELRREQAEISLKDNFAQHAKKERKILKLKEDLKKYGEDWHRSVIGFETTNFSPTLRINCLWQSLMIWEKSQ